MQLMHLRTVLPTVWACIVLAHALPTGQAGSPTAVLAGMQVACIAALGTLAAATAVREQRGCSGHADRCQEDERFTDALEVHRVGLLWEV